MIGAVIAIRDNRKTLLDGILSVAKQVDSLVVVYDGCQDQTWETIVGLSGNRIPSIGYALRGDIGNKPCTCIRRLVANKAECWNIGAQLLSNDCEYIAFVEDGVVYATNKITRSIEIFDTHKVVNCVVSDSFVLHENNVCIRKYNQPFDGFLLINGIYPDINCVIRKSSALPFDENLMVHEDYEWFIRMMKSGLIYHIPEGLHTIESRQRPLDRQVFDTIKNAAIASVTS